jgi:Amt family ammonium transporter
MGNPAYVTIGTLILWLGWYGFNCGSTLVTSGSNVGVIGRVGVNCTLGAASGGLTTMFLHWFKNRGTQDIYSVGILCNGILAGLVGITASCNNIEMEGAFVIGIVAGCVYYGYKNLLEKFKIDDPLDAFPLHGGCGSLGLIAVGWFDRDSGILYGHGGA